MHTYAVIDFETTGRVLETDAADAFDVEARF